VLLTALLLGLVGKSVGASTPRYDFEVGMWRNLHHLLYAQALSDPAAQRVRRIRLDVQDEATLDKLSDVEQRTWKAARDHYVATLIGKNLLFDDEMLAIGLALSKTASAEQLPAAGLPRDLHRALSDAGPIYRKYWWPAHRARARQWASEAQALLDAHGAKLRPRLEAVYAVAWPDEPVVVDLVYYANSSGAYTILGPTRIAIATSDAGNWNQAALEILLHETTHAMLGPLQQQLDRLAEVAKARPGADVKALRRDLWHEVQFFLTGAVVARELPGYRPYADKNDLWSLAWPGRDRTVIESEMTPYLEGEKSLGSALQALVDSLVSRQAQK